MFAISPFETSVGSSRRTPGLAFAERFAQRPPAPRFADAVSSDLRWPDALRYVPSAAGRRSALPCGERRYPEGSADLLKRPNRVARFRVFSGRRRAIRDTRAAVSAAAMPAPVEAAEIAIGRCQRCPGLGDPGDRQGFHRISAGLAIQHATRDQRRSERRLSSIVSVAREPCGRASITTNHADTFVQGRQPLLPRRATTRTIRTGRHATMTYSQWNVDQSDLRDEQQDGMGCRAQPEQADFGGRRQNVAG
jgi:hypothetical protein